VQNLDEVCRKKKTGDKFAILKKYASRFFSHQLVNIFLLIIFL
jgi:hypothetical protein